MCNNKASDVKRDHSPYSSASEYSSLIDETSSDAGRENMRSEPFFRNSSSDPPEVANNIKIVWEEPASTDAQLQVHVEERRRTVFIKSDVPPDRWDVGMLKKIGLELSTVSEGARSSQSSHALPARRAQSWDIDSEPHVDIDTTSRISAAIPQSRSLSSSPNGASESSDLKPPSGSLTDQMGFLPASFRSSSPRKLEKRRPATQATPAHTLALPPRHAPVKPRIYFYNREDPYYGFTNFSPHSVEYKGKIYPTSEHLFQSFKFQEHRPLLAEHIRTFSDRPSVALSEARRFEPEERSDWKSVNVKMMDVALWHKFMQHQDLKRELLDTGEAELIEDSDKDSFWGVGANRQGRNELGKALVRLRSKFRDEMV